MQLIILDCDCNMMLKKMHEYVNKFVEISFRILLKYKNIASYSEIFMSHNNKKIRF